VFLSQVDLLELFIPKFTTTLIPKSSHPKNPNLMESSANLSQPKSTLNEDAGLDAF